MVRVIRSTWHRSNYNTVLLLYRFVDKNYHCTFDFINAILLHQLFNGLISKGHAEGSCQLIVPTDYAKVHVKGWCLVVVANAHAKGLY